MTVRLTICQTCKNVLAPPTSTDTKTAGALLTQHIVRQAQEKGATVDIQKHDCLWACKRGCAVTVQSDDKMGYLAGDFLPNDAAAAAILAWCAQIEKSKDGIVPFANWPDGMKGKFIARLPPK